MSASVGLCVEGATCCAHGRRTVASGVERQGGSGASCWNKDGDARMR